MPPPPHTKPENVLKVRQPHFQLVDIYARSSPRRRFIPAHRSVNKYEEKLTWVRPQRAQELIEVKQSQAALALLHEHVTSKRTRNSPIASLEPVMVLFVELCVELRKGKSAKDGLYSYKNTAQNTNVGTIEV